MLEQMSAPPSSPAPLPASPARLRPAFMRVDARRCTGCGLCAELSSAIAARPARIPVTNAALEAMSACPTGAIVWREKGRL
jgi:ferredoxin